jgi:predicted CopG family antitoxin
VATTTITIKSSVHDLLLSIADTEGKSVSDFIWDLLDDYKKRNRLTEDSDNDAAEWNEEWKKILNNDPELRARYGKPDKD